jgi:hypothetical protein
MNREIKGMLLSGELSGKLGGSMKYITDSDEGLTRKVRLGESWDSDDRRQDDRR